MGYSVSAIEYRNPTMNPDENSRIRAAAPWLTVAVFCAGLIGLLAGCGQRGPLYLPEEAPPTAAQPSEDETTEEDESSDEKTP